LHGHRLTGIPAVNPGDQFGKAWLLEIGGHVDPLYLAVEADTAQDALDALADSDEHGHRIRIDEPAMGDYAEQVHAGDIIGGETLERDGWLDLAGKLYAEDPGLAEPCRLGNAGEPCDLDHVAIHGQDGVGLAGVRYHSGSDDDKGYAPAEHHARTCPNCDAIHLACDCGRPTQCDASTEPFELCHVCDGAQRQAEAFPEMDD
jgi:hypothetical protein